MVPVVTLSKFLIGRSAGEVESPGDMGKGQGRGDHFTA